LFYKHNISFEIDYSEKFSKFWSRLIWKFFIYFQNHTPPSLTVPWHKSFLNRIILKLYKIWRCPKKYLEVKEEAVQLEEWFFLHLHDLMLYLYTTIEMTNLPLHCQYWKSQSCISSFTNLFSQWLHLFLLTDSQIATLHFFLHIFCWKCFCLLMS